MTDLGRIVGVSVLAASAGAWAPVRAAPALAYVAKPAAARLNHAVVIDTRAAKRCVQRSVAGARCLSPADLLGPHGRLPAFRQLVWVLGTAGLTGRGTVIVAGDNPMRRDFVAGLLYLLGQQRVRVLMPRLSALLDAGRLPAGVGTPRGVVAQPLFQAQARGGLILFRGELLRALQGDSPPRLVDGRSDARYWGNMVTAPRGGHIPGAVSLPVAGIRARIAAGNGVPRVSPGAIAYASDPEHSIAYFTLLTAGLDAQVRVFPGGWRAWAAHTDMPVASETLPPVSSPPARRDVSPEWFLSFFMIALASLLVSIAALTIALRRRAWT